MGGLGEGEPMMLPLDREGFLRRECPSCHRQFKVRATEQDALMVQRSLTREIEHANAQEVVTLIVDRFCPYCGATAPDDAWFTAEQREYLEKRAEQWGKELRYVQLSYPLRTLGANPYLTYVAVKPEACQAPLRPEPEDMRVFPLMCCRDECKLSELWNEAVHCFFCGTLFETYRVAPGFLARLAAAESTPLKD